MREILLWLLTVAEGTDLILVFSIALGNKDIVCFRKKSQLHLFSVQLEKLTSISDGKPHQCKIQTILINLFLRDYDRLIADWIECFLDSGQDFTVSNRIRKIHDYCYWCLLWNEVVFLATQMKWPWKMLRYGVAHFGPCVFWLLAHIFFNHRLIHARTHVIVGMHLVTEQG